MPGKSQPRLNLRPVMAGVKDSSPEDPNPFPLQPAEERALFEPPDGRATGKLREPSLHEPDVLVDVRLDDGFLAKRE